MIRKFLVGLAVFGWAASAANAQTTLLSLSSDNFQVTTVFSNVDEFQFDIEIDGALQPGVYNNPPLERVTYSVTGELVAGTPSGFPAFALQRDMDGAEFYAQGSSLSFEVAATAVLTDGVQIAELVGNDVVFTFNGREIDNGRFHPALLELRADGTGRIQNSNNIVEDNPLLEVTFGQEYITDLAFDAGNTTLLTEPAPPPTFGSGGGSGALSVLWVILLLIAAGMRFTQHRRQPS
ncbi:MAG: hypothetical protein AAFX44_07735 [Pseudomonadota bacterium]